MNQHEQRIAKLIAEDPAVRQQIAKTIEARRRREAAAREARQQCHALERMLAAETQSSAPDDYRRRRRNEISLHLLVRHEGRVDVLNIDGDDDVVSVMIDEYEGASLVEIEL